MDTIASMVIALCVALIAGLGTASAISKKMMSRAECKDTREGCELIRKERFIANSYRVDSLQKSIECLKRSNDVQYEMLRSIVIHMPGLSDGAKEKILNAKVTK